MKRNENLYKCKPSEPYDPVSDNACWGWSPKTSLVLNEGDADFNFHIELYVHVYVYMYECEDTWVRQREHVDTWP